MIKSKTLITALIIGLLLRCLVAATTFHPDVKIINYTSAIILKEGNLNPYSFEANLLTSDTRKQIYQTETPDDLPLQYWIHVPIDLLLRPFINPKIEATFLSMTDKLFGNPALYIHLLLIKFPLILFDLVSGLLIVKLVKISNQKKALWIWVFNPVSLWATAAIGQVDIMPTFFLLLSLYFYKREKLSFSAFSLGVGAALKSFPLLFLPLLILSTKSIKGRIWIGVLGLLPDLLTVLPYLPFTSFRDQALLAPQLDKVLYATLPISGGESLILAVVFLVSVYFFYQHTAKNFLNLCGYELIVLLGVLALTHFHPQWFLWLMPLGIIYLLESHLRHQNLPVAILFVSWLAMIFLFDASLQLKLLVPIFPTLNLAQGLVEKLSSDKLFFFRSMIASLFAGSAIYLIFSIFKSTHSLADD